VVEVMVVLKRIQAVNCPPPPPPPPPPPQLDLESIEVQKISLTLNSNTTFFVYKIFSLVRWRGLWIQLYLTEDRCRSLVKEDWLSFLYSLFVKYV
jgi:hypothetical protein